RHGLAEPAHRQPKTLTRLAVNTAVWLSLAACSSPYEYSKEVGGFGTGVDHVSGAITDGFTGLSAEQAAELELAIIDKRPKLILTASCGTQVADPLGPPCLLKPVTLQRPALHPVVLTQPNVIPAVQALSRYAHSLTLVTNASDRTEFDAASKRVAASVGTLAEAADPVAPGASKIAPVVVNVALWVVGEGLD